MWNSSWIAFDTETTGLSKLARVLEMGIVYFENGVPVEKWSTFLNPPDLDWNHPNVLDALKVNGLSKADVVGAPRFEEIATSILEHLEENVWVGHNIEFDIRMLQQECERAGIEWKFQPGVQLCTQRLSYKLSPNEKSHRLGEVAPRWGVTPAGAHRAIVDADTCGRVLQKMFEKELLPIEEGPMVSFQKEASAAWARRPRGR